MDLLISIDINLPVEATISFSLTKLSLPHKTKPTLFSSKFNAIAVILLDKF